MVDNELMELRKKLARQQGIAKAREQEIRNAQEKKRIKQEILMLKHNRLVRFASATGRGARATASKLRDIADKRAAQEEAQRKRSPKKKKRRQVNNDPFGFNNFGF